MSSNQPSDALPPSYHNLAMLLAQASAGDTSAGSASTILFSSLPFGNNSLASGSAGELRCSNPNCLEKGEDVDWFFKYNPYKRICNACKLYQGLHGVHRSKELCDRSHATRLAKGKKSSVRKPLAIKPADMPYRHDENKVIFEVFSSLSHDASDKDKRNAALSARLRLGKGVRTGKRILEHVLSDSYKLWKAEYEQTLEQSSSVTFPVA